MDQTDRIDSAIGRVIELDAELETAAEATTGAGALAVQRDALHAWIDTVAAVVVSAGLGRVTLIHANGSQSGISSSELPFLLSRPAKFGGNG